MGNSNKVSSAADLAAWMRRMNLSLTAAADKLGRKRATITRYVSGETELPESVAHHAELIEASREGRPFESRRGRKAKQSDA